jgi:hypothetical protein
MNKPALLFMYSVIFVTLGLIKKHSERNGLTLKDKKEQERYGSEYDINPERDEKNGLPFLLLKRNKKNNSSF